MNARAKVRLVIRAFFELARFDVIHALGGFGGVQRQFGTEPVGLLPIVPAAETAICEAVVLATCLYWKPVACLQRSMCAARMLRARGVAARLVIGYRPTPFFSHAWVEVDGRVVNDSPEYPKRLRVLHTL